MPSHLFLQSVQTLSLNLNLILAESVCASGIHSCNNSCSHCQCFRELLLVIFLNPFSAVKVYVSGSCLGHGFDWWVWGKSGNCNLQGPVGGCGCSLSEGQFPAEWLLLLRWVGGGAQGFAQGPIAERLFGMMGSWSFTS